MYLYPKSWKQKMPKIATYTAEQLKPLQNILCLQMGGNKVLIKLIIVQENLFIHLMQCSEGQRMLFE